ncbi:MAG TPA: DNA-protecting protein DprA [Candidatus Rokubacteria bacterium]|nr:DNA-protecting protein DprA [Candidatus Rokubacteria bacterium]
MTRLEPGDPRYPALLAAVPAAPALDVRGTLVAEDALAVAIVGARRATPYGVETAEGLAADLAARGVTIVSGLARGIDTAAHRGALAAGGRTLAVLGSGIDVVYPPENRALAGAIARQGALLSQFPAGAPGLPGHFPARNRTIAGLALGVVVVEAAARSGALITAGFAGDLGREVFAVPGRISSAASAGAHRLIQDGAKLVTCWQDVVQELPEQWRRALRAATTTEGPARPCPESDEGRMLDALTPDEPQHIERLIVRGGLPAGRAAAALVTLELGGLARQLAGQRWMRTAPRAGRG